MKVNFDDKKAIQTFNVFVPSDFKFFLKKISIIPLTIKLHAHLFSHATSTSFGISRKENTIKWYKYKYNLNPKSNYKCSQNILLQKHYSASLLENLQPIVIGNSFWLCGNLWKVTNKLFNKKSA